LNQIIKRHEEKSRKYKFLNDNEEMSRSYEDYKLNNGGKLKSNDYKETILKNQTKTQPQSPTNSSPIQDRNKHNSTINDQKPPEESNNQPSNNQISNNQIPNNQISSDDIDVEYNSLNRKEYDLYPISVDEDGEIKVKLNRVEETVERQLNEINDLNKEIEEIKSTQVNKMSMTQKEGYLFKEGFVVHSWKRRFFFLESENLYYARSKGDRFNTMGTIPLCGAKIYEVLVPGKDYSFAVKSKLRTYFMVASNNSEKIEWMNAIVNCIKNITKDETITE